MVREGVNWHSGRLEPPPGNPEASLSADATAIPLRPALATGNDRRLLLPIDEVAELTGVSEATLRREAPIRRIGKRTLIPRAWVDRLTRWPEGEAAS